MSRSFLLAHRCCLVHGVVEVQWLERRRLHSGRKCRGCYRQARCERDALAGTNLKHSSLAGIRWYQTIATAIFMCGSPGSLVTDPAPAETASSPDASTTALSSLFKLPKIAYSACTCSPGHSSLRATSTYILGNLATLVKFGSTVVPVYLCTG